LQMLAPNIASLLTGQPPPALPNIPKMPGKVPSTDDSRISGAMGEATQVGINFLPLGGQARAIGGLGIPALMGLLRREAASGAESLASKVPMMYNPPVKSPRPFAADYPSRAPADAAGRLTADLEGRPLTARYVVGRRVVGGNDEALPPAEFNALTEETTGRSTEVVPPRATGGNLGRTLVDRVTGRPFSIQLRNDMAADKAAMVHAHELGHVIDQTAARFPPKASRTSSRASTTP
jgi:hypothetical protein